MGTGGLTEMSLPDFAGINDFAGIWYHTARWPKQAVDFSGKRVGVFGTGATGIQVIQTIAAQVEHLKVFQRTPTYTIPMKNPRLDEAQQALLRAGHSALKERVHDTFSGAEFTFDDRSYFDLSADERHARMEELWAEGSLSCWVGSCREILTDQRANAEVSEFVRKKIRARVNDPVVAEKLVPSTYGFGTRRVPLETGYQEA